MEGRSIWSFHGLTGYFIAVALLLSILVFLSAAAIKTQSATAQQSYEVKDPLGIKKIGPDLENEKHIIVHGTPVGGDKLHKYQFVTK
ncbi:hypothetical protein NitYY0826_C1828 [Nitratiruptor sp. YY08-26]|uniref:DUF4006 family protein n=1 Tax=unclassified Nitratiruptor TaxID=2624044 RepID=UPI001916BD81|nr:MULTISPECIES: DUF4006 family protein [unclassified Nitratiruptor]BCD62940.1 hypothetical protein NitYY0813_C1826 [Nitratiruptor sp. YY08-13]BCD66875.1 hypothetical protein NitYY0826_C1828 [Nitratiruptor sp. YY08-26]